MYRAVVLTPRLSTIIVACRLQCYREPDTPIRELAQANPYLSVSVCRNWLPARHDHYKLSPVVSGARISEDKMETEFNNFNWQINTIYTS